MTRGAGLALAIFLCGAVAATGQETAEEAYQRKDFATAREAWLKAAEAGSAQAKLGLGLLADRGLGEERDPEKAFNWYLDAAIDGLAEAQFNVGVMLDAGIGTPRNLNAALVWYARAALRGHSRAQYNLGLLYADEAEAPTNPDLAAYWFRTAASVLPAAQLRLDALKPGTDFQEPEPPTVILAQIDPPMAEIVWSGPYAKAASGYQVEIVTEAEAGEYGAPVLSVVTEASALLADDLPVMAGLRARVSQLLDGGANYIAGPWMGVEPGDDPKGRVEFVIAEDDARMSAFASVLAADLRQSGYWVRVSTDSLGPDAAEMATAVTYAYDSDKALAGRIAAFLPVLSADDVVRAESQSLLPGEIRVRLAGMPVAEAN